MVERATYRYTSEEVRIIRVLYSAGVSVRKIARLLGIGKNGVRRKTSDLRPRFAKLSSETVARIREGLAAKKLQREIAKELQVSVSAVERHARRLREAGLVQPAHREYVEAREQMAEAGV